jgi:hypothetical protein
MNAIPAAAVSVAMVVSLIATRGGKHGEGGDASDTR